MKSKTEFRSFELTARTAAREFGISQDRAHRAILESGKPNKPGTTYPLRDWLRMLHSDTRAERARLMRAQADAQELENAERLGLLVARELVMEELWSNGLSRVRESLRDYRRRMGPKLRAMLQSGGCAEDVIQRVIDAAAEAAEEPLDELNKFDARNG